MAKKEQGYLEKLIEYFPTAIYTGEKLVFVSENWNVELDEHVEDVYCELAEPTTTIRVVVYKILEDGTQRITNSRNFSLTVCSQLAASIEKYIQNAIGASIKES